MRVAICAIKAGFRSNGCDCRRQGESGNMTDLFNKPDDVIRIVHTADWHLATGKRVGFFGEVGLTHVVKQLNGGVSRTTG